INNAFSALPASGGSVYLMEGTYTLSAAISIPNNTTLGGAGTATIITLPNAQNGSYNMITNSDTSTGTNVTIENLLIDGNKANQSSGSMKGIFFNGLGSNTTRSGGKVLSVTAQNVFGGYGIMLIGSANNTINGNTSDNNGSAGIYLSSSTTNSTVSGNVT